MSIIEVSNLTKYYGKAKARGIVDVSFNVDEGEIFGFIGFFDPNQIIFPFLLESTSFFFSFHCVLYQAAAKPRIFSSSNGASV